MRHNQPIGILGGTYDPIHQGHIHLANEIYQRLHLKEVHLVPCFQPVHRDQPAASPEQRLAMVKLAIAGNPGLLADDREILRRGPSYMIDTLLSLRQETGANTPLCLIMATDAFAGFDKWRRWQEILALAHLVIANRPDHPLDFDTALTQLLAQRQIRDPKLLEQRSGGHILFLDIPHVLISATEIRALIAAGKEPQDLLAPEVLRYIRDKKLYQHS